MHSIKTSAKVILKTCKLKSQDNFVEEFQEFCLDLLLSFCFEFLNSLHKRESNKFPGKVYFCLLQSKNHIIVNAVTFQIKGNERRCWMFDQISIRERMGTFEILKSPLSQREIASLFSTRR